MSNFGFKLPDQFIDKFSSVEPNFGFNGLGKIAYLRTYSRKICNKCLSYSITSNNTCENCNSDDIRNEHWHETVRRVVEGTYSMQKDHINKYGLGWNEEQAIESAKEMYERMFYMKFLPAGRGLWAMGTDLIHTRKLHAALANCAFYSTENIDTLYARPFKFMMDMSMLGVGVGFDVKGANKLTVKQPKGTFVFIIPDSREGWVDSLEYLLNAYFKGDSLPTFDYSVIRPAGEPIKIFGGTSSGPDPLRELHERTKERLINKIGKKLTVTDIVDLMNWIGCCVVAGNVRRTAQISFGDPKDNEYLLLKDYHWNGNEYVGSNAKRASYGWTSNNSIFAEVGMNYKEVANQTSLNGEPGYVWLETAKAYGRLVEPVNNKDFRAGGTNPCGEQTLESGELCCLVETFITKAESLQDYKRTLKFAYLYAKTITLGTTHWVETNRVMLRNRRIGTSVSGIAQFVDTKGLNTLKTWLNEGYETIKHYDEIYSDWLAIPKSIKMTSIKPSGTVSLLAGVTPGVHYPESNYYIRRIRLKKDSNIISFLKKSGYTIENDLVDTSAVVVEIPVSIEGVRTTSQVSIWEKVALASFIQTYWADNQVSCTVTFSENEKDQIEHVLNYFQYSLKGISFLPKMENSVYQQMPYEEITKSKYEELIKKIKPINTNVNVYKIESSPELYCDGDSCQLK
jgi:adenosylcobalamin-dependent ribonucleoside-triphosphate reductase